MLDAEELLRKLGEMGVKKVILANPDLSISKPVDIRSIDEKGLTQTVIAIYHEGNNVNASVWMKVADDRYDMVEVFKDIGDVFLHHSLIHMLGLDDDAAISDILR